MAHRFLVLLGAVVAVTGSAVGQEIPRAPGGLDVTPKGGAAVPMGPYSSSSLTFLVYNDSPIVRDVDLSCGHAGAVTSCSVDNNSFSLDPYDAIDVDVDFTTGGNGGGTLSLIPVAFESDSGWRNITVQAVTAPTLSQPRQADSVVNHSHCLTAAAALGAWSCGDGLLFLSTPSVMTLDRARSLTLVHATGTVVPRPLVMVVADLPSGPTLDHVTAVLTVRDTVRRTAVYYPWGSGPKQLVLDWDASNHPTGLYPYTLTVRSVTTVDSAWSSVSGLLHVVNRGQSPYGKGWEWLGVERLVFNQPVGSGQQHLMWVGGDGSSKLYRQNSSTVWVAPKEAFPDTIVYASGEYTRQGPDGLEVVFDGSGRHVRTSGKTSQVTTFHWTGDRIDSVWVPPSSGGRTFRMKYDGNGRLDSVVVAPGKGVDVAIPSGVLTDWVWPDGTWQTIDSDMSGRPTWTSNIRGGTTRWIYGDHGLLVEARSYYAVSDSSVTKYTPWQAAGYAFGMGWQSPGDTANAVTTIFGPRVGVNDDARFHVDRWGAVIEMRDALGVKTKFVRGDSNVPALVTRIDYPNSRQVHLQWNARGNLTRLADSTWGAAAFPKQVTSWSYGSANAPDSPTSVTGPGGETTSYVYNAMALVDSMIDPRGLRTVLTYQTSGSARGQVLTVTERAVPTWVQSTASESNIDIVTTLTYDGSGNTATAVSPSGGRSRWGRDSDGRIIADTNAVGLATRYVWDVMDRQTHRIVLRNSGGTPSPGCVSSEFICTDLVIDALNPVGTADTTSATYTNGFLSQIRDPRGVLRSFRYDLRGLMVAEVDEAGAVDSARYDAAGLLTTHRTRYAADVSQSWDVADRLIKTVIPGRTLSYLGVSANVPADSVTVSYDSLGNVLTMVNRHGTIRRSYYETGHLKGERVVPTGSAMMADSTRYEYDGGGRLSRVTWYDGSGVVTDSVVYRYNGAGDLDTMRIHIKHGGGARSESWRFTWDNMGRRRTVHYPYLGMTVDYRYDGLSTLRRVISSNPGSGYWADRFALTVQQDSVDVLGRVLSQKAICPYNPSGLVGVPCGGWLPEETSNRYDRLGNLVLQQRDAERDTLRYDQSGNLYLRSSIYGGVSRMMFSSGSNRLTSIRDSIASQSGALVTLMINDAAGNRLMEVILPDTMQVDTMAWQYDVLGRMMGIARRRPPPTGVLNHFNECHWDGAWRASQPCGMGAIAFLGSNVSRSSQGWTFFQAPGIDETLLSVEKVWWGVAKRLQSVTDGRGQLLAIADSLGDITAPYAGAGYDQGAWKDGGLTSRAQTYSPRRWETDSDWGEMQQFRHRAYDPRSARWLQEDPIGLSGGVNLYRYNDGNPVRYSDPYGMCPPEDEDYSTCEPGTSGWYAHRLATGEGNQLLNEAGGLLTTCAESAACSAVLVVGGPVAGVATRVGSALRTAVTATGNVTVEVGSAIEARIVGRLWVGGGSRFMSPNRYTGEIVGRVSADMTRTYRYPALKQGGIHAGRVVANLGNGKMGNTHLLIP